MGFKKKVIKKYSHEEKALIKYVFKETNFRLDPVDDVIPEEKLNMKLVNRKNKRKINLENKSKIKLCLKIGSRFYGNQSLDRFSIEVFKNDNSNEILIDINSSGFIEMDAKTAKWLGNTLLLAVGKKSIRS